MQQKTTIVNEAILRFVDPRNLFFFCLFCFFFLFFSGWDFFCYPVIIKANAQHVQVLYGKMLQTDLASLVGICWNIACIL